MNISFPNVDFSLLLPGFIVAGTALLTMLLVPFLRRERQVLVGHLAWIGLAVALYASAELVGRETSTFGNMFISDSFSIFFNGIFLLASILTIFMSMDYLKRKQLDFGEFYPLVLFATYGMMVMASSANLVVIFIGLEIMSLSLYVLAGFAREQLKSTEAAIKYFLLGAFASGFTVLGIAFIYGATGTFDMLTVAQVVKATGTSTYLLLGGALILIGLGFKIAAVPFHMWAADVYEGAPTPVTGFMSAGPKAAAFAALLRIFSFGLGNVDLPWETLFWILAAATMTVGNIMALRQGSIKRMLAFSSIAHAGYIMIALVVGTPEAASAAALYLLCYAVTNLGAFIIITAVDGASSEDRTKIDHYAGLARRHPLLAVALTLFLISLAGFPPTAGFIGKFVLFKSALTEGFYLIVVLAVLNSLVSVYYYLRVVVKMFMADPEPTTPQLTYISPLWLTAAVFAVLALFMLGIYPQGWFPFDGLAVFALN
ncbi:MAG: NADH-quinone oxidoreductase subunit N [bacterium]